MPEQLSLSYYPWITQSISGPALAAQIDAFVKLLEAQLSRVRRSGVSIKLLPEMDIPEQLNELEAKPQGNVIGKIGLLNPIGYALVHSRTPDVQAVAVVRRKIGDEQPGPTYKAQLYTHRKSGIKKLDDVRGRSIGFGSPQSTSNFLVPAIMLWRRGIHPLNGFSRVEFTGGHDKAAIAVFKGQVDVGAGHDGVISDLKSKPGFEDAEELLFRLAWSAPIPSDPVAIHTADKKLPGQLAEALIALAVPGDPNSAGNQVVKRFWGINTDGFETIGPEAYESLLDKMCPLSLRPEDILRRT